MTAILAWAQLPWQFSSRLCAEYAFLKKHWRTLSSCRGGMPALTSDHIISVPFLTRVLISRPQLPYSTPVASAAILAMRPLRIFIWMATSVCVESVGKFRLA